MKKDTVNKKSIKAGNKKNKLTIPVKKTSVSLEPEKPVSLPDNLPRKRGRPRKSTIVHEKYSFNKFNDKMKENHELDHAEKHIPQPRLRLPEGSVYQQTGQRRPLIVFPK